MGIGRGFFRLDFDFYFLFFLKSHGMKGVRPFRLSQPLTDAACVPGGGRREPGGPGGQGQYPGMGGGGGEAGSSSLGADGRPEPRRPPPAPGQEEKRGSPRSPRPGKALSRSRGAATGGWAPAPAWGSAGQRRAPGSAVTPPPSPAGPPGRAAAGGGMQQLGGGGGGGSRLGSPPAPAPSPFLGQEGFSAHLPRRGCSCLSSVPDSRPDTAGMSSNAAACI